MIASGPAAPQRRRFRLHRELNPSENAGLLRAPEGAAMSVARTGSVPIAAATPDGERPRTRIALWVPAIYAAVSGGWIA